MDALSEAMRAVRVTGALFFSGEFAAPWRFATPAQEQIAPKISPDSERLVLFHLVTDGHATARTAGPPRDSLDSRPDGRLSGHDEVNLTAGDMIVFPHGDAHELWHGRTSKLFPGTRLLPKLAKGELAFEKWGGKGPVTRIICGYLGCERHAESLFLSGLPAILKTNLRSRPVGAWIESALRHYVSELESQQAGLPRDSLDGRPDGRLSGLPRDSLDSRPDGRLSGLPRDSLDSRPDGRLSGRLAVLAKLAETLFVETLCRYMDELPPEHTGWLAGARDTKIGQALALMHRDPARAWTLPDLARASGVSRTVLVDRFTQLMGESPLAYLARWRLQLGARRLLTTDRKVLQVAHDVGYESEAAFSRAFRRAFGVPPARYRRERKAEASLRGPGASNR